MINYQELMTKVSESIGQSPVNFKFDSEAFIGDLVHMHTDRDGNIPEPGKLTRLFSQLSIDLEKAFEAVDLLCTPDLQEEDAK